jgi:hypothetical protein
VDLWRDGQPGMRHKVWQLLIEIPILLRETARMPATLFVVGPVPIETQPGLAFSRGLHMPGGSTQPL